MAMVSGFKWIKLLWYFFFYFHIVKNAPALLLSDYITLDTSVCLFLIFKMDIILI